MKSKKNLWLSNFSHIYIEREILDHKNTKAILEKLPNREIIIIDHYKDVFNRGKQEFALQKKSPKLILGKKRDSFLYEGSKMCNNFGHEHFYYSSTILNCLYDCEYCYLRGLYSTGNIVFFVNTDDFVEAARERLKEHGFFLCISYDSDLLALEGLFSSISPWIDLAKNNNNVTIELRTKSSNYNLIKDMDIPKNVILAWTLSPRDYNEKYELKTPSLESRLSNIRAALNDGHLVRICLDPLLYLPDYKEVYKEFIYSIKDILNHSNIVDISAGTFRVPKEYIKKMRKLAPNSLIANYPYEGDSRGVTYKEEENNLLRNYVKDLLLEVAPLKSIEIF